MTKKKVLSILLILLATTALLLFADNAFAQEGLIPAPEGGGDGDYSINDFVRTAVKVSQLILGLVGSLSLIMFVYGGVTFMISGGSSEKIAQAKKILVASVVGLVIVFSSWLIIRFVVSSLGATGDYQFNGEIETISRINK